MRATVTDRVQKTSAAWVTPGVGRLIALPRAVVDLKPLPVVLHFKPAPAERAHRSISLSCLLRAQRRVRSKLRHCRPRVAIVVRVRHRENELPSPSVASPWSSLPSPPHRRVNRASVRANRRFSSTTAMAALTGVGAPRGQRSSRPCHPSSVSR